jgi:hypothetical protein
LQDRSRRSASTLRSVSGIRRRDRDGGGSDAAVVVTGDVIHLLGGAGYRHAVRDDAFYVPRLMLERSAESGPIARYRGWLAERASPSEPEESR